MEPFEWQRIFLGEDHPWYFLFEIMFRSVVMYVLLIAFFKITGKTGIRQLSAFDLILIIGLGSAAGDPMFYDDVPLLHAAAVFTTILLLYLGVNRLTQKSPAVDAVLEGEVALILRDGEINYDQLMSEGLTLNQFFSELRQRQVSHLGQVRLAYIEVSGETSIFFVKDDQLKPGLPILPDVLKKQRARVEAGFHSCVHCGYTQNFDAPAEEPSCLRCSCKVWVMSWDEQRTP